MKDMLGKSGFDVIGDVHGHAAELTILFKRMGYQETNGVLRHPEGRRVVFLGDFIDRGPEIRRTLEIVRGMVEAGSALAVMGNHELNALHYTMPDPVLREEDGGPKWLRSHSESHRRQFEETVRQLGADLDVWLAWIRTLPVWMKTFDSEGVELRFVHAAWMETKMRRLWEEPTDSGELRFTGPFEAPVLTQAGLVDFGRRKDPVSGKPALGWKYKEKFRSSSFMPKTKRPPRSSSTTSISVFSPKAKSSAKRFSTTASRSARPTSRRPCTSATARPRTDHRACRPLSAFLVMRAG